MSTKTCLVKKYPSAPGGKADLSPEDFPAKSVCPRCWTGRRRQKVAQVCRERDCGVSVNVSRATVALQKALASGRNNIPGHFLSGDGT